MPNLQDVKAWAVSPVAMYKSLNGLAMSKVGEFNARQRQLPVLERQVEAIRLYAEQLNSSQLRSVYSTEKSRLEELKAQTRAMAGEIHNGLQSLIKIRQGLMDNVPGAASALGAAQWVVPIAIVVAVLVVVNRIDSWIKMHDGSVNRVKQALTEIDKLKLTQAQKDRMKDYVATHGGLPNPDALTQGIGAIGTTLMIGVVAFFLLTRGRRAF